MRATSASSPPSKIRIQWILELLISLLPYGIQNDPRLYRLTISTHQLPIPFTLLLVDHFRLTGYSELTAGKIRNFRIGPTNQESVLAATSDAKV
jgi:hypothetical protein